MAGRADYTWLDGCADSRGARAWHVYRSHAHVSPVDLTNHGSFFHLGIPSDAATNPTGHRLRRVAAARHSVRCGSVGARRLDSERNSVSLRDHSQRLHGSAGRAARGCALAWVTPLARNLESNLAPSVSIN